MPEIRIDKGVISMILKSIKYNQFSHRPEAWYLEEFKLGPINLIVGKNATGKTRTLNIIGALANLLTGTQKLVFSSGDYDLTLTRDSDVIRYVLVYENSRVLKEELIINSEYYLKRGAGGKGVIKALKLNQDMEFQTPENELACVARRDSVQHPFFEDLYKWGKSTRHYHFGTQLGKDYLIILSKAPKLEELNLKDENGVVSFYKKGVEKYGDTFTKSVIREMALIGYACDEIGVGPVPGVIIQGAPVSDLEGIYVKESDLNQRTYQHEISQGMFRALSLIIQLNFNQLESIPSCILVDDIGEGLDYDRSTALIKLLIEKSRSSSIQMIMSTNDRFVMNNVPLEYWCVIQRIGDRCRIFNYQNSKKIFDDFKFTGLSNFDFLSTEFYLKGFNEE